ncbi:DUF6000 family protein [Streptomyces capitiformicae]|uniref:DUF6000 family protein n=1 Tax=Streptomyces capitiformicae TaxID=2014920 RepID=UPI0027E46DF5|nr:DUF6000 family protein [Streptomyces capitiformicae]
MATCPAPTSTTPVALGALLRLDSLLGTAHAAPFTEPGGLFDRWVDGVVRKGYPSYSPAQEQAVMDELCDFADGWSLPE